MDPYLQICKKIVGYPHTILILEPPNLLIFYKKRAQIDAEVDWQRTRQLIIIRTSMRQICVLNGEIRDSKKRDTQN